jgi:hypothetical protein
MKHNWLFVIACAWILWGSNTDLQIWDKTQKEAPLKSIRSYNSQAECEDDKSASLYIWVREYRAPGRGGATEPVGNRLIVYDKPNDATSGKVVKFECWPSDFDPRK